MFHCYRAEPLVAVGNPNLPIEKQKLKILSWFVCTENMYKPTPKLTGILYKQNQNKVPV